MRKRLFMIWAALRWVPLMFLIAPVMEAPLVAHLSDPVKPIKSWVGNEIDVSYRVARKLGLIRAGVNQVRLELLELPAKR